MSQLHRHLFLALVIVFILPATTHANFVGNDTQNFNPSSSGLDFVTVESAQTLDPGILSGSYILNLGKNSLPDGWTSAHGLVPSRDQVTFADLAVGYGLGRRWDLGVNLSFLLDQKTDRENTGAQFAATGLNEVRLNTKYKILERQPVGVAFMTSININESRNNPFAGRGGAPTLNLQGIVDYQWRKFTLAANAGYRLRSPGRKIPYSVFDPLPDQVIGSLAANYYFTSANLKVIGEIFAARTTRSVIGARADQTPSDGLVGVKYDAFANVSVDAGAGMQIGDGLFTPDFRVYVGLSGNLDMFGGTVAKSSPSRPPPTWRHYLGYLPKDIEALAGTDFDEIAKTHEFHLRTDIPEKDIAGLKPPFEIIRLESFNFDTGSSRIRPQYQAQLDKLAAYLASPPVVLKIRVEGHTDSLGSAGFNHRLSQSRSDALKAYLNGKPGLERLEIEPAGFGADRPISDNGNFQGRRDNRRVEIRILRRLPEVPEGIEPAPK